ncbi:Uncharacterized protein APZ42_028819 [Daphnia magna]|uniref:Uncharacterized protein n=1 Tax=Daphnia magna TaxID=35525 RepID=A0A162D626_9CRUS|nr:Uncharacterized protein APZ42_028819 [Daphnia magna]
MLLCCFKFTGIIDDLSFRPKNPAIVTEAVVPINPLILSSYLSLAISTCTNGLFADFTEISSPSPPPSLSPNNLNSDLDLDIDLTLPPPPYPSDNEILIDESFLIPPPEINVVSPADNVKPLLTSSLSAAAIEWNHSPTVSPQRGEGIVNLRPTYDTVEVPIHKTPDRPLRELKYSFHDKYLRGNQKGNIIFDGLGFSFHIKVRKFKRDRPAELSDFIFIPHSEENPHNHSPNIETAEVIDVRNEDKKAGLVNKLKPAKKI